ncbi:hypothetical protein [Prescottella equi]
MLLRAQAVDPATLPSVIIQNIAPDPSFWTTFAQPLATLLAGAAAIGAAWLAFRSAKITIMAGHRRTARELMAAEKRTRAEIDAAAQLKDRDLDHQTDRERRDRTRDALVNAAEVFGELHLSMIDFATKPDDLAAFTRHSAAVSASRTAQLRLASFELATTVKALDNARLTVAAVASIVVEDRSEKALHQSLTRLNTRFKEAFDAITEALKAVDGPSEAGK